MKEYPETHQRGMISIENIKIVLLDLSQSIHGDFGIQIANDGRVWVCINGVAFLRFKPNRDARLEPKEHLFFNRIREAIRILKGE